MQGASGGTDHARLRADGREEPYRSGQRAGAEATVAGIPTVLIGATTKRVVWLMEPAVGAAATGCKATIKREALKIHYLDWVQRGTGGFGGDHKLIYGALPSRTKGPNNRPPSTRRRYGHRGILKTMLHEQVLGDTQGDGQSR